MTREELMLLCLDGMVDEIHWRDRDSAIAMMQLGQAYALLAAHCKFIIQTADNTKDGTAVTDDRTIWIQVQYKGFDYFEESVFSFQTFYIPTRQRLHESTVQTDWY